MSKEDDRVQVGKRVRELLDGMELDVDAWNKPDSTLLVDLEFDSLDVVALGMEVEEEYSIIIPSDALRSLHTIGDLTEEVIKRRAV